jgi:hypothetical protein
MIINIKAISFKTLTNMIINIRATSFKTLTNMIINIRATSFKTLTKQNNQHKDYFIYEIAFMLIIMLVNVLNEIAFMLIITFS